MWNERSSEGLLYIHALFCFVLRCLDGFNMGNEGKRSDELVKKLMKEEIEVYENHDWIGREVIEGGR